MAFTRHIPQQYHPGAKVTLSGIYRVNHQQHRPPHDVLAIKGEELPQCRTCGSNVSFELVQGITLATHDMDLAGPSWPVLTSKPRKAA